MRSLYRGVLGLLVVSGVLHQAVWPQRDASAEEAVGNLGKLAPAARQAVSNPGRQSFIVQFQSDISDTDVAALRQAGAHLEQRYRNMPMAVVTASGATLRRLVDLPRVTHISPNEAVEHSAKSASRSGETDGRKTVGANAFRSDPQVQRELTWNAQAVWSDGSDTKAGTLMAEQKGTAGAKNDEQ